MANSIDSELGSWKDSDRAKTAQEQYGVGADGDLPEHVRFQTNVAKLIRRRQVQVGSVPDPNQVALFLMNPSPPSSSITKRNPTLDQGLEGLSGKVWFVSPAVISGRSVEFDPLADIDRVFSFVVEDLDHGSTAAILYNPQSSIARFYPNGLSDEENCSDLKVTRQEVTLEAVSSAIDSIHSNCLETPELHERSGKLWEDGSKCWPVEHAESLVQLLIKPGLAVAFPLCTIRTEQTMGSGRSDVEVEENDPSSRGMVTRHALLELKVLRSYGSTGNAVSENETKTWIEDGVKQAASYREEKNAIWSALLCFDMRKINNGNSCFDHVSALATKHEVGLKRWYLYSTSKKKRSEKKC